MALTLEQRNELYNMLVASGMTAQQASDAMAVAVETGVMPTVPQQAPAAPRQRPRATILGSQDAPPPPRPRVNSTNVPPGAGGGRRAQGAFPSPAPGYPSGRPSDGSGRIEPKRNEQYVPFQAAPRRWASGNSRYTLEGGRLVGFHSNGQVDIQRPDGRVVHPHVSELSADDQIYVAKQRESFADFQADNIEARVRDEGPPLERRLAGLPGSGGARASGELERAGRVRAAGRAAPPGVGAAMPRVGDLVSDAHTIDNLEGADPQPAANRQAKRGPARSAPRALPKGFTPVNIADRTWTSGQYSRTGRVVGVHQDGTVLIEDRDGTQSKIPVWKLDGKDAAHLRASLPLEVNLGMQMSDPAELEKAHRERAEWMLGEKEGRLGDGRDKADTDRKMAEFRRQRRAGMRPGTDAERQYEMFGPGGDDAAARAESQAAIDAQVAAGAKRDKQVRQSIDRDKAKYGPGKGVTRFDQDGEPIAAAPMTDEQQRARWRRDDAEDRTVVDPSHIEAMIARLARANGISRGEARAIYEANLQSPPDGEEESYAAAAARTRAAMKSLRDDAGSKRDAQLASQRDALRRQNMLAGNNPRANLTNAFGTMDKEWQDYVMARLMGANPGMSPSDAAIEREKLDVVRAEAEARAAEAARAGRQADRANDLAERGLGLKEQEQNLEAEARAQAEAKGLRDKVIKHHSLPMPGGDAGFLVESELAAGRFDHPEVVKFVNRSALKLLDDARAWDDDKISDEEAAAVDAILARLGAGYQPGGWRKAAESMHSARSAPPTASEVSVHPY